MKKIIGLTTLLISCMSLPSSTYARSLWEHDYEEASIQNYSDKWYEVILSDNGKKYHGATHGNGEAPSIQTKFARKGKFSLRTGTTNKSQGTKHRSEMFLVKPNSWHPNTKRYIGFSLYIPEYTEEYVDWTLFLQAQMGWTNPSFALGLKQATGTNDSVELEAVHRWGNGDRDGSSGRIKNDIGSFKKGEWHDFVVALNFNPEGNGLAKVYHFNGEKWKTKSLYVGRLGNKWSNIKHNDIEVKYGLYMGKNDKSYHEHWFDQVKFSSTFRGAKP